MATTLSQLKQRYAYLSSNEVFTTRAMWDMAKYLDNNQSEIYWDYSSSFSDSDFKEIHESGWDGLYSVKDALFDMNIDYIADLEQEAIREVIPNDLQSYKLSYLTKALRAYREEDEDANIDDLMNLSHQDFLNLELGCEEAVDMLRGYSSVSLNTELLFRNSSYNKAVWIEYEDLESDFADEIAKYSGVSKYDSKEYTLREEDRPTYIKICYKQDSLEDIASTFHNFNKDFSTVNFKMEKTLVFETERGEEEFEVEVRKDVTISISDNFTVSDSDEYVNSEWSEVIEIEEECVTFYTDEEIEKFYSDLSVKSEDMQVKVIMDGDFYITEATKNENKYRTIQGFKAFGYSLSKQEWEEKQVQIFHIREVPEEDIFLSINGLEENLIAA